MNGRLATMLAGTLLLASSVTHAARLRGTFQTLMAGREDPRRGDVVSVVPVYELVALRVSDIDLPGAQNAQVVMQGWGRLQLGADELDARETDLALLYLDSEHGPLRLRLGRQHVAGGVGRMDLIDGVDARLPLGVAGMSLEAYGGANVHRRLRYRSGGYTAGTRLAKHFAGAGEVGVGYKRSTRGGEVIREDLGLDGYAWVGPARVLALAMVSTEGLALVEGRLAATFLVTPELELTADAERTVPDLMLARDSIFTVFSNVNRDAAGLEAAWSPSVYYEASAQLSTLLLDGDFLGYRGTLVVRSFREPTHASFVGAELQRLDEDTRGYVRGRVLTALQLLEPLRVSADLYAYSFDEPVNGVSESLLAHVSLVYDLAASMRVAATLSGGITPYADKQVEGMLRFAYGYDVDFAREMGP